MSGASGLLTHAQRHVVEVAGIRSEPHLFLQRMGVIHVWDQAQKMNPVTFRNAQVIRKQLLFHLLVSVRYVYP